MNAPEELRRRIVADLRPVRPLLAPWQRVMLLVPAAVLAFAAGPSALGIRSDFTHMGPVLAWGGSLIQLGIALALIAAALREVVPGDAVPGSWARLLLLAGAALIVVLAVATNVVSPEPVARAESFADWFYCWRGAMLAGAPLLLVIVVLLARGLAMRPALAGALAGMGAASAIDAGWRLACNYSNPSHVLASHGGAVLALTAIGAVAGVAIGRARRTFR